jgi:hypothetical protein
MGVAMMDISRYADLKKLSNTPAAKILAQGNAVLQTRLDARASASVAEVLLELETKGALIDMLQLLAHSLPAREAIWWACLSARDILPEGAPLPTCLKAAEAWVYQPGVENRTRARAALDGAGHDDDTVLCAMAACFADGTLGPGELEDYEAPRGAVGGAVFGMALMSLFHDADRVETRGPLLLARAIDIARGGSGNAGPNAAGVSIPGSEARS